MSPPTIGVVGIIGAGKSTVARMLRELGCVVCDSDALAREAFRDDAVRARLRQRWGTSVFDAAGEINRKAVAETVFGDQAERLWLESIVHPWIEARRRALFDTAPQGTRALVIDAPLLLEAGLGPTCDAILFVDVPRETRLARVRASRGWDGAELARRESAQWPLERKRAASTNVIVNDSNEAALRERVRGFLAGVAPPDHRRDADATVPT